MANTVNELSSAGAHFDTAPEVVGVFALRKLRPLLSGRPEQGKRTNRRRIAPLNAALVFAARKPPPVGPFDIGGSARMRPHPAIRRELKIALDMYRLKAKWRVTLFQNPETKVPTTYKVDFAKAKQHWSFRPITKPAKPAPADPKNWVKTPIDAFALAKLTEHNLAPSPQADKTTLLRRATFDLCHLW